MLNDIFPQQARTEQVTPAVDADIGGARDTVHDSRDGIGDRCGDWAEINTRIRSWN